jgi:hypothetical protein
MDPEEDPSGWVPTWRLTEPIVLNQSRVHDYVVLVRPQNKF